MICAAILDEHRALCHREKRVRRLDVLRHRCLIQTRGHLLHWIEIAADAPQHEVRTRAQPHRRISMNHELPAKIIDRVEERSFAVLLFIVVESPPGGQRSIESEVNELPWKLALMLFEFLDVGSKAQRTTRRMIILVVLAAHKFPIRRGCFVRLMRAREKLRLALTHSAFRVREWQPTRGDLACVIYSRESQQFLRRTDD